MILDKANQLKTPQVVEECARDSILARIDAVCEKNLETWLDVYKDLSLHKSIASKIRRGLYIPPQWQRIQIAQRMKIDSTVIWKIPEIISAEKYNVGEINDNQ